MLNGDLSNDLTKRLLVTTDVFITPTVQPKKFLKLFSVPEIIYSFDIPMLSRLYLMADRQGVTLELVGFEFTDEEMSRLTTQLDEYGTNPFRYYTAYKTVEHLVAELPYRPEIYGVLDTPDRMLRYGHWGLDYSRL